MAGADIGLGWIDQTGNLHFEVSHTHRTSSSESHRHSQDRYAFGESQPVVDNTTTDWFGLQGREENGWTAIQFKRAIDTCDTMDVPIKVRLSTLFLHLTFT